MTRKEMESNLIKVYHGSDKVLPIEDIILPNARNSYDFGQGFYLTTNQDIAEEWSSLRSKFNIVNIYELDLADSIHILDYTWLDVVVRHRTKVFDVLFYNNIIIGKIADDCLMDSLTQYLDGAITDACLIECLTYVNLGDQYVIKKDKSILQNHSFYNLSNHRVKEIKERRTKKTLEIKNEIQKIQRRFNPTLGKFIDEKEIVGKLHIK